MGPRAGLYVVLVNVFLDLLSFGIVIPLLPFYAQELGASPLVIGALLTVFATAQLIFAPIWGRLSDAVGRRPVILGNLAGAAISYVMLANSHTVHAILLARVLAGIASANVAAAQAYIADTTPPEKRAKGMAWLGAAQGLGLVFGPALGGLLSGHGFQLPFYVAAALYTGDAAVAYFLLPESVYLRTQGAGRQLRLWEIVRLLEQFSLAVLLVVGFLLSFSFQNIFGIMAIFFEAKFAFTGRESGYMFTYVGVIAALTQVLAVNRVVKRFGERRVMSVGIALEALGLPFLALGNTLVWLMLTLAALAIAVAITNPSLTSLVSKNTPRDYQGGILGVMQSLASLAGILGPLLGGYLFGRLGPDAPFFSGGLFALTAFVLAVWVLPSGIERPVDEPS